MRVTEKAIEANIRARQNLSQGHGSAHAGETPRDSPIAGLNTTIKASEVRLGKHLSTEITVNGKIVEGNKTEYALPPKVMQQGMEFLEGFIGNLNVALVKNPHVFDRMPDHQITTLFDNFTKIKYHPGTSNPVEDDHHNPIKEVDREAIVNWLNEGNGKNWVILMAIMEDQSDREARALAMYGVTTPPGNRENVPEPVTQHSGIFQGKASKRFEAGRRAVDKKLYIGGRKNIGSPTELLTVGTVILGGIGTTVSMARTAFVGGLAVGGIGGAVRGGIGGAIAGAASALGTISIATGRQPGVVDELRFDERTFEVMRRTPGEADLMRALGVDVDDYRFNNGKLELIPGRTPMTAVNVKEVQDGILRMNETRRLFFEALDVKPEDLDMSSAQALFELMEQGTDGYKAGGTINKTGTHFQQEVNETWNPNHGGIVDRWGNHKDSPFYLRAARAGPFFLYAAYPGALPVGMAPPHVLPAPDANNRDYVQNAINYYDAQKRVILGNLDGYVRRKFDEEENGATSMLHLNAQKEKYAPNGAEFQHRAETALESQRELGRQKVVREQQRDAITAYRNLQTEQEEEFVTVSRELGHAPADRSVATVTAGIDVELAVIRDALRDPGPPPRGLEDLLNTELSARRTTRQRLLTAINHLVDKEVQRAMAADVEDDAVMIGHNEEIARLNGLIAEQVRRRTTLTDIRESYAARPRRIQDAETQLPKDLPTELIEMEEAINRMLSAGTPITAAMLENPKMTVQQIYDLATDDATWPPAGPNVGALPHGTDAEIAAAREMIVRAQAEGRAKREETAGGLPLAPAVATYAEILNIVGATITQNELLTLDNDALTTRLRGVPYAWPVGDARFAHLPIAIAEAGRRIILRQEKAIPTRLTEIERQEEIVEKELERHAQEVAVVREGIDVTFELRDRQKEIYGIAGKRIASDVDRYLSPNPVDPADPNHIAAEKEELYIPPAVVIGPPAPPTRLPEGYLQLMDVLFNYRNTNDREGKFRELVRTFPPDVVAGIISSTPTLGLTATNDIVLLLTELHDRVQSGVLKSTDVEKGIRHLIRTYVTNVNRL